MFVKHFSEDLQIMSYRIRPLKICTFLMALFLITQCYGQIKICLEDSTKCYFKTKYFLSNFEIERKNESVEDVRTAYSFLLADMDGDCVPEFIVPGVNWDKIIILDSKTGRIKWEFSTPTMEIYRGSIAVADVDNDRVPEIFIKTQGFGSNPVNLKDRLICYSSTGLQKWISDQRVNSTNNNNNEITGMLALADFNQDGIPELYINNQIFNARTGVKLVGGGLNGIGKENKLNFDPGPITVAAQLDNDTSDLELAAGYTIYKVRISNTNGSIGNGMTPYNIQVNNVYRDGFTTVGDINLDGKLDVIVTSPGINDDALLYAYTFKNGVLQLLAMSYPQGAGYTGIGPACIGDIHGNGRPSILITRDSFLYSYTYNGTSVFQHEWSMATSDRSGSTGVTLFDLNHDGINDIVYRDETNLKIINGSVLPPKELASIKCLSPTLNEYPLIGDIDNSGHAKICVSCDISYNNPLGKLTIFGPPDSLSGWAPARGVWNQYNYHVLNINDDLTVPRVEKNNATYKNGKYNNFYVQESLLDENGMYKKLAASLWGRIHCIHYDPFLDEYIVSFDIFNKKDASALADINLPVSFYNGNPSVSGKLLGTYYTQKIISVGDSLFNLEFHFKANALSDLFMVVNTKRDTAGIFNPSDFSSAECDYTDNYFHTLEFPKIKIISISICNGSEYQFYDTTLTVQGRYVHSFYNTKGCDSLISVLELTTVDSINSLQTLTACDSFNWNGIVYRENGTFMNHFQAENGCDSIVTLNLIVRKSNDTLIQTTACRKFGYNDKVYTEGGKYYITLRNHQGCDSLIELDLNIIALDTNITKLGNTLIALDSVATYQWVDCNNNFAIVPGATQKTFKPNKDGSYAVIITTPPCIDTSACLEVVLTQTINSSLNNFIIYPNPAKDELIIESNLELPYNIKIESLSGSSIHEIKNVHTDKMIIPVENYPVGLYIISIQNSKKKNSQKWLKI